MKKARFAALCAVILMAASAPISALADSIKTPVAKLPDLTIQKAEKAPTVDGKVSAGEYPDAVYTLTASTANRIYNSPRAEAKGQIYMTYDDATLYVAVVSDENTAHLASENAAAMWQGDCVQFYFLMVDPAAYKYSTHRLNWQTKMGLSASSDFKTQQLFRWIAAKGKGVSGVDYGNEDGMQGDDFSTSAQKPKNMTLKLGNQVTYEIAIPWDVLMPEGEAAPKQGDVFGMSLGLLSTNPEGGFNSLELGLGVVDNNVMKSPRIILGAAESGDNTTTTTQQPGTTAPAVGPGTTRPVTTAGQDVTQGTQGTQTQGTLEETQTTQEAQTQGTQGMVEEASGQTTRTEEYVIETTAAPDGRITVLMVVVIILGVLVVGCAGLMVVNFLLLKKRDSK